MTRSLGRGATSSCRGSSPTASRRATLARFSARFSLMDFADFLDMAWRGDLSLIAAPSSRLPEWLRAATVRLRSNGDRLRGCRLDRAGAGVPRRAARAGRARPCGVPMPAAGRSPWAPSWRVSSSGSRSPHRRRGTAARWRDPWSRWWSSGRPSPGLGASGHTGWAWALAVFSLVVNVVALHPDIARLPGPR